MNKKAPTWVVAATFFGLGSASVCFFGWLGALAGGLAAFTVFMWLGAGGMSS